MKRSAMPPIAPPQATLCRLPRKRRARVIAALALSIATAVMPGGCGPLAPRGDPPLAGAQLGGDFTLVDKTGKTVRYADFAGKWRVVYFGYTFCPDVCPLDLQHLMQGFHAFARAHPEQAERTVPLFISVDPARDTPQVVGQFAGAFGPELIGLTGSERQVAGAAKAFAVFYQKRPSATPGTYLMDHSRAAYLMDPQGKPVALLPVDESGPAVAAELAKWDN